FAAQSTSPSQAIPTEKATAAFAEVHALCTAEHGKLWGHSLCVPMMFVDPDSREAVLNQPANDAARDGAIYRLALPQDIGIANTSLDFQGRRWSMVMWPLPTDKTERDILLMHESYHSIQPVLGLQGNGGLGKNGELDSRDGRIWLRAEFSSLHAALQASGQQRKQALADALLFRAYRMSLWTHAATDERSLELNEGLAESTGIDASQHSTEARVSAALHDIEGVEKESSFVRSFAYATGPAYAELLDAVQPDWRRKVTPGFAFGMATAAAYHIAMPKPDKQQAMTAIAKYDGKQIIAEEDARAKVTAERNARFAKALVSGSTLTLPLNLKTISISYDPRMVYTLPGHGSVYQTLTLGEAWGKLTVHDDGMALIPATFDSVTVPLERMPTGMHLDGKDWSLTLNKGFRCEPDPKHKGSFVVTEVKP
ncbi:MAG TPA: hypothetical protein VFK12_02390, partial [Gammaproteobacteria bacterium]|nr:hypothetical protein [Gammaproteobacteria bacterium]